MTEKPKIQYIGQFYVHGSEAQAVQRQQKKAKTKLPQMRVQRIEKIYVDPVALGGIVVALVMLVAMVVGAMRIRTDWNRYEQMKYRVSSLTQENKMLQRQYRETFDLESIRSKAQGMGMIHKTDAQSAIVYVTIPEPKIETTWLDDVKWFFEGLIEKPE